MSIKVEFGFAESGAPVNFNDISAYVINVSVNRGKDPQQENYNAASCSIELNNETRNFDPDYGPSPYQGLIVPTGQLKVYSNDQIIFTGFITDWNFAYSPNGESVAEIVASDAFWNLNNQTFTEYEPIQQISSTRIQTILSLPEVGGTAVWPTSARVISPGIADLGDYAVSDGTNVLSYLQNIERSEPGRLFIDKRGRIVFRSRNNDLENSTFEYFRTNLSTNPSFENNVRGWQASSGTITRSTATAYIGTASASLGSDSVVQHYFASNTGDQYTASIYTKASSGTASITIAGLVSFDGSSFTESNAATSDTNSTDWTRVSTTFTASSSFAGISVSTSDSAVFLDALLIEQTPVVDAYFDGDNEPVYNTSDPDAPDYQPEKAFETYETEWIIEE
jgi:hypothetical protein